MRFERLLAIYCASQVYSGTGYEGETVDGGIDGVGILSLGFELSFTLFQCKRYREVQQRNGPNSRLSGGAMQKGVL
jgi:hypothetical protein